MIEFEKMLKENGNVNILDKDDYITIQMEEEIVKKIFDDFNKPVKNKKEKIIEFDYYNEILELSLKFHDTYADVFSITGRLWNDIKNDSLYFREFEIEDCDIETWNKLYDFLKQK